jgi:hypothetical protein
LVIKAERAVAGRVSSAFVELGISSGASALIAPPEAPQYSVRMNLYGSDWNGPYYRDVRSGDAAGSLWVLAVNPFGNEGGSGSKTVTLSWDANLLGGESYELREGADGAGAVLISDMSEVATYTVSGDNRDQYFSIVRTSASNDALPSQYELSQNYPNPFNPSTQISFALPGAASVRIEVLNILGQHVATILDQNLAAGRHNVTWNASDEDGRSVASGVYLYRLTADQFTSVKKMVLLR